MQIHNFNFFVDFIIIDTAHVTNASLLIPVILEHPFFTIASMVSNCRNGVVKLSFDNITLELNLFNVYMQPNLNMEEVHYVNRIEEVYGEDDIMSLCISDLLEMALMTNNKFLDKFNLYDAIQVINFMSDAHCMYNLEWIPWKEILKELPPKQMKLIPSRVKALSLELKPLSENLKYLEKYFQW